MSKEKLLLKIIEYLIQENNYDIEIPYSYESLKNCIRHLLI